MQNRKNYAHWLKLHNLCSLQQPDFLVQDLGDLIFRNPVNLQPWSQGSSYVGCYVTNSIACLNNAKLTTFIIFPLSWGRNSVVWTPNLAGMHHPMAIYWEIWQNPLLVCLELPLHSHLKTPPGVSTPSILQGAGSLFLKAEFTKHPNPTASSTVCGFPVLPQFHLIIYMTPAVLIFLGTKLNGPHSLLENWILCPTLLMEKSWHMTCKTGQSKGYSFFDRQQQSEGLSPTYTRTAYTQRQFSPGSLRSRHTTLSTSNGWRMTFVRSAFFTGLVMRKRSVNRKQ